MFLGQITLIVVYALSMALGASVPGEEEESEDHWSSGSGNCNEAQQKCAFRSGCYQALRNYIVGCSGVLYESNPNPTHCPISCQHALIALTSSDEGKELTQCKCEDESCRDSKKKLEICRPSVVKATRNGSIVSCEVAHWICSSDGKCATALEYYQKYCNPTMFHGKECSKRCRNSINILMRQEKAKKLSTCICKRHDDADCWKIQRNMDKLCFNKTRDYEPPESNEIESGESNSGPGLISQSLTLSVLLLLKSISGFLAAF